MQRKSNQNPKESHRQDINELHTDTHSINDDTQLKPPSGIHEVSATSVADIIGEYGIYQLSLTILTFIRYTSMAMMTNAGPLLAPDVDFWCQVSNEQLQGLPKDILNTDDYLKGKCHIKLANGSDFTCTSWIFSRENGTSLTTTFELVCEREWLRSAFQSIVSVGIVAASLVWGSFSDRHGRKLTIKVCFFFTLIFSCVSYLTGNFLIFSVSRALSSFGDLGLVVSLSTIIVETLGNKYRGTTGLIVYSGWSLGVMIMPWLVYYYQNFRQVSLFLIVCHLLTFPWLMTIGESVRWSLVNGYVEESGQELCRISKWNLKGDQMSLGLVDMKFNKYKVKFTAISERVKSQKDMNAANKSKFRLFLESAFGGLNKVGEIFRSEELSLTALTIIWTTFNSELMYMLFVLINSDIGDNIKLNYAIGGVMEILSTFLSMFLISLVTRRISLIATLVSISTVCFTLAFTHQDPSMSFWVHNLAKLAISTLTSLVYVTTTEIFPTNLRQTGFGLSGTLGSFGAVVAPFIRTELTNAIGMTRVMLIIMMLPLSAATLIPFFLKETKGVDISDDVDELGGESLTSYDTPMRPRAGSLISNPIQATTQL